MNYEKLLLDELRLVRYEKGEASLTEELLAKAVTLNENLTALGYCLSPADLAALAVSPSLDGFYEKIKGLMDEVKAEPMYPGFPEQVMEMDEAVFRFHQMIHYFSTYGMELLFGVEVKHGWLPHEGEEPVKTEEQDRVLDAKTIKLIPSGEVYITPLRVILSRRERMTLPEKELVTEAISKVSTEEAASLNVRFKENMNALYAIVFALPSHEDAFRILRALCKHTGDVLRCVKVLLERNKYHLHNSQKRFLVKLLESYPVPDFRGNLILSRMGAQRNVRLIEFLDYSVYSRSAAHMEAVNALRDGALHSWMSIAQRKLVEHDADALDYLVQRPGIMLRMAAQLLRNGYPKEEITEKLVEKADVLSMQTIITSINKFYRISSEEKPEAEDHIGIFESLIPAKLKAAETPLHGKKVKLSMDGYALDFSEICCNDKSAEGGYIRSGIAYKIPDEISRVRFFVYWNDEDRVDVDLHAAITDTEGECFRIGWNGSFRDGGAVFSGDITQSNAAEYIDIDMSADIKKVFAHIHLFSGKNSFADIETCYVGMMAVPEAKQTTRQPSQKKLYSEKNCFFKHNLRQNCRTMNYGYIDVQNRYIVFEGKPGDFDSDWYAETEHPQRILSINRYLEYLFDAQGVTLTEDADEADIILVMGKPSDEKELSLLDENFFMDSENEQ